MTDDAGDVDPGTLGEIDGHRTTHLITTDPFGQIGGHKSTFVVRPALQIKVEDVKALLKQPG